MVSMPIAMTEKLMEETKRISVGWNRCRMERRITLDRCYRCHGHGHTARSYKEPQRSKCCVKCGNREHEVLDCTNTLRCYDCAEDGHRADNMACPKYREIVENERRRFDLGRVKETSRRDVESRERNSMAVVETVDRRPADPSNGGSDVPL